MKQFLYTIEDTVARSHSHPIQGINDGQIIRSLQLMANSPQENELKQNIEDKKLWRIAEMNIETGEIKADLKLIMNVEDLILTEAQKDKSVMARMTTNEKIKYLEHKKGTLETKIKDLNTKKAKRSQKGAETNEDK